LKQTFDNVLEHIINEDIENTINEKIIEYN